MSHRVHRTVAVIVSTALAAVAALVAVPAANAVSLTTGAVSVGNATVDGGGNALSTVLTSPAGATPVATFLVSYSCNPLTPGDTTSGCSNVVVTIPDIANFPPGSLSTPASLTPALVLVATVGAGAGCGYVTGFTLLQESVADEMRGRTFATLYAVVRICLLLSLTIGPFVASGLGAVADATLDGEVDVGSVTVSLPGVRLALWLGGLVTVFAGLMARRRMRREAQVA